MSLQQETTDTLGSLVSDTVEFFTTHNAQNEEILGKMPTDLKKIKILGKENIKLCMYLTDEENLKVQIMGP